MHPKKSGSARMALLLGTVQLLFLDVPAHAAIDLSVRLARGDVHATHFSGLVNAVLRKIARDGAAVLAKLDGERLNTPDWLWRRWSTAYGAETAHAMAAVHRHEPPLDLSVKTNAAHWASTLNGELLQTGTVRLRAGRGSVDELPGFAEGEWWVQDAAAAIPAKLFGPLQGKTALDLCAAPGGKTLQLCALGANVTSVDQSARRLERLRDNLRRTGYASQIIVADVMTLERSRQFDAVLLDAPCSATGTIRRHPDIPYRKSAQQIETLGRLQEALLAKSASFVKPGGVLVYCTCSLEPEEGEHRIERFLDANPRFAMAPITHGEAGIEAHLIDAQGQLRTLPHMTIGAQPSLDGFFAARLTRRD